MGVTTGSSNTITLSSNLTLFNQNLNINSNLICNQIACFGSNVGIYNSNPQYALDIIGNINLNGNLYNNGVLYTPYLSYIYQTGGVYGTTTSPINGGTVALNTLNSLSAIIELSASAGALILNLTPANTFLAVGNSGSIVICERNTSGRSITIDPRIQFATSVNNIGTGFSSNSFYGSTCSNLTTSTAPASGGVAIDVINFTIPKAGFGLATYNRMFKCMPPALNTIASQSSSTSSAAFTLNISTYLVSTYQTYYGPLIYSISGSPTLVTGITIGTGTGILNVNQMTVYSGTITVTVTGPTGLYCTTSFSLTVSNLDGSTSANAALSAVAIKNLTGTNTNGVYWINLPTVGPTQIYCIMDSAVSSGGWMMAMKTIGYGTTFYYYSSYWTNAYTLNASDTTRNANDAKYNTFNYYQSTDMMAIWPDIPYTGGTITLPTSYGDNNNVWCWLKLAYASQGQTLLSLFTTTSSYYFRSQPSYPASYPVCPEAGNSTYTSVFSQQPNAVFYGINFNLMGGKYTRWGIVCNENNPGDFSSCDVCGGIGMDSQTGNMSSGDYYGCCGTIGINRSARVEMYIR